AGGGGAVLPGAGRGIGRAAADGGDTGPARPAPSATTVGSEWDGGRSMKCARVQDRLLLYLAGELEPREEGALRSHLESCPGCAAVAAELAETQELVTSALRTAVNAPATLQARVMAAARREPARRRRWAAFPPLWSWKQRFAATAVALCLLIGGYGLGHWHGGK